MSTNGKTLNFRAAKLKGFTVYNLKRNIKHLTICLKCTFNVTIFSFFSANFQIKKSWFIFTFLEAP